MELGCPDLFLLEDNGNLHFWRFRSRQQKDNPELQHKEKQRCTYLGSLGNKRHCTYQRAWILIWIFLGTKAAKNISSTSSTAPGQISIPTNLTLSPSPPYPCVMIRRPNKWRCSSWFPFKPNLKGYPCLPFRKHRRVEPTSVKATVAHLY